MSRRSSSSESKVYIGDLARDTTERDIEKAFGYYGPIKSVWVARNPPGFAFVEYEDTRDAEDAVKELDGSSLCGGRIRVEMSTGRSRPKPWMRDARDGGRYPPSRRTPPRRFDPSDRCYECGERGHYAYDCRLRGGNLGSGSRRRSRSRSRSPRRRSYSRSPRRRYSRSRSRSRSRSGSRSVSPRRD